MICEMSGITRVPLMEMHTELLTVVVPVLNEENRLAPLTSLLNALRCPVIVVDGGSTDGTYEALRASAEPHIEVTRTTRGRAVQMNFGASMAETPFLMFLHADTSAARRWRFTGSGCVDELRLDLGSVRRLVR